METFAAAPATGPSSMPSSLWLATPPRILRTR